MADTLSKIAKPTRATRAKRLGRGVGSGLGKTAGRGQKGQYARTRGFKPHFEGGQTPLQRRLPKRGFINPFPTITAEVNVGDLDSFAAGRIDADSRTEGPREGPLRSHQDPRRRRDHQGGDRLGQRVLQVGRGEDREGGR